MGMRRSPERTRRVASVRAGATAASRQVEGQRLASWKRVPVGIPHHSKICVQRYEKYPFRITTAFLPVANCRAHASIAYVPLPGMTTACFALYTCFTAADGNGTDARVRPQPQPRELRGCWHTEEPGDAWCSVAALTSVGDVVHRLLEGLRHVVERTIGVYDATQNARSGMGGLINLTRRNYACRGGTHLNSWSGEGASA